MKPRCLLLSIALLLMTTFVHAFDHTYPTYAKLLDEFTQDGLVDYKGLKENPALLDQFLKELAETSAAQVVSFTPSEKVAFWSNAYNAIVMKVVIDRYPIKPTFGLSFVYPKNSIRQIPGAFKKFKFMVAYERYSLDDIEHQNLRAKIQDPRVHVSLVCAAISCPPLRHEPYMPEKLDAQLFDQAKKFVSHPEKFRIDREKKVVYLSHIYKWFGADFIPRFIGLDIARAGTDAEKAAINYSMSHLSSPDDEAFLKAGDYKVEYVKYDWTLNEWEKE